MDSPKPGLSRADLRDAIAEHFGPGDALVADYEAKTAALGTRVDWAFHATDQAVEKRETGRGRRPSLRDIRGLLRREDRAFTRYDLALKRLDELTAKAIARRRSTTPADLVAQLRVRGGARS